MGRSFFPGATAPRPESYVSGLQTKTEFVEMGSKQMTPPKNALKCAGMESQQVHQLGAWHLAPGTHMKVELRL